ncbi:Oidioi.mRNA.OKI2018_I69.YSR.g17203.t1.cds [Oikopleura dioica]|uniref:ribonuclease H n=1 Tax=Oikopleura dioica TaxID=34765 RepID=A0ABN7SN20_OIKDI|nr:Oidioi.mRNA.OKI2018_I69.YSR.g17203.t1.cds [Oikopleura dioica]
MFYAPSNLKFINVNVNGYNYVALLDTGASKTCINSSLPFVYNTKPSKVEIICANNQFIRPSTLAEPIKMTVQTIGDGKLSLIINPLVVDSLCVPVLIGCDLLKDVAFPDKKFIVWKNKQVRTIRPDENSKYCNVNAIVEIKDSKTERESLESFQRLRSQKAEIMNFKPEIGSFGDTTSEQEGKLIDLVGKYKLAFSMGEDDLGKLHYFRFTLPMLDESQTTHQPPRPIPIHMRDQVSKEIERWKSLDIIRETSSGFNIPLIILKKHDGSIRISLDARSLNKLIQQDRFPLPHLSVVLTDIGTRLSNGNSCFISQIDCHRGYWQIQTAAEDSHKLAFSFNNKHYAAQRMLYGVSTAPSAFSRIMQKLLDHPSILLYLDDIICIDNSFEKHLETLEFIFKTCVNNGLLLSPKKCFLCRTEADFLGYSISKDGVRPTDKHLETIKNLKAPKSKSEVKRLLGVFNYNIKFIRDGSAILQPLYDLTSKNVEFQWADKHEHAFQTIKNELLMKPSLSHFQLGKPLILVTDSSGKKVGGILYQRIGENLNILGYFSKALKEPDLKRSMRIKELFALAFSISHFEYFLLNTHFTCVVDHKSLCYLFKEQRDYKNNDIKLTNIHNYLLKFNFTILHEPGTSPIMCTADYLSRLEASSSDDLESDSMKFEDIPETVFAFHTRMTASKESVFSFGEQNFTAKELSELQRNCVKSRNLIEKCGRNPKSPFQTKDGLLYKDNRLVLPEDLSNEFISFLHCYTCHAGSKQLNMMLKRFFIHDVQTKPVR